MAGSKMRVLVSWFLIITIISLTQFAIYKNNSDEQSAYSGPDIQAQMSGKYYIGLKQLAGQNPLLKKRVSQLEQQFKTVHGENRQISSIPILAEISGKDAALEELESMAADSDNPSDMNDLMLFYQLYNEGTGSLDSGQMLTLERYGWIGRLALSQNKPDSDPERKAVLRSALRTVILIGIMAVLIVAAVVSGSILFIIAMIYLIRKKLKSRLVIREKPGGLLLESFALYLLLSTILPVIIMGIAPGFGFGPILFSFSGVLIAFIWPLTQGAGWNEYRTALGWIEGKGFFREAGAGIVGYIAGLPLLMAALIMVTALSRYTGETPSHPLVNELSQSPLYLFLLACVWAPVIEETLFRGALYGYLRRFLSWPVTGAVTGLIFGILHPQGWVAVPALAAIGFNLSVIREWRGSIIASVTAHALNNGFLVVMLLIALS